MKTKLLNASAVIALAVAGGAIAASNPMVGGAPMLDNKNIVQNAVNSKDHTTLVAAVKAGGLADTLQGPGPFTVFAPTNAAFAALPAGIGHELLRCLLLAGHNDLLGIDNDYEIAGVHVRRINGLVLSAQNIGDLRSEAAQDRAVGVNHVPLALIQVYFGQMCLHLKIPSKEW